MRLDVFDKSQMLLLTLEQHKMSLEKKNASDQVDSLKDHIVDAHQTTCSRILTTKFSI